MPIVVETDEDRYMFGRRGDHMMTPFQCDLCHFRNIQKRDPSEGNGADHELMIYIRRANLDALWSREPGTVYGNLSEARRMAAAARAFGVASLPVLTKPAPVDDLFGMLPAVLMLKRSQDPGRNRETIQFNTARKVRSVFSNYSQANLGLFDESIMAKDEWKLYTTTCPTFSRWFERFVRGCHSWMGDQPRPDRAIGIEDLTLALELLDQRYLQAEREANLANQVHAACLGVFMTAGFLGGLRGEEVLLMELTGVRKYPRSGLDHKTHPHVALPLYGRFKGENGTRWFYLPIIPKTDTSVNSEKWMTRMVECYERCGIRNGWVFRGSSPKSKGKISDYDPLFHDLLSIVQERRPDLIKSEVEVGEVYSLRRSLRRGSTTHAQNQGVRTDVIEYNNRWRKHHHAGGKAPSLSMVHHYTDIEKSLPYMLQYSKVL